MKDEALDAFAFTGKRDSSRQDLHLDFARVAGPNGYKPFVLLYTTGGNGNWRNAEGMLSKPRKRSDFFSKESRRACPVHVPMVPTTGVAPALSEV